MILVFKTNISNKKAVSLLKPHIDRLLGSHRWNFDLQDRDKIFRVEASGISICEIQSLFLYWGYHCEELPD